MNRYGRLLVIFSMFVLTSYGQRYEAENAVLSGGAIKQTSATRSGGQYVSQNEGTLTFNLSLSAEGFFNIIINAAAPGGNKINIFYVNENTVDFSTTTIDYSSVKVVTGLK